MECRATSRMTSSLSFYHKASNGSSFEKNKFANKRYETNMNTKEKSKNQEATNTVKNHDAPVTENVYRRSNAWKQSHGDSQDKGFEEPYVHEYKEFPGVTITIRAINNPKAFASLDPQSKVNLQNTRRKSDNPPQQGNNQDRGDQGEKTEQIGASNTNVVPKPDTS